MMFGSFRPWLFPRLFPLFQLINCYYNFLWLSMVSQDVSGFWEPQLYFKQARCSCQGCLQYESLVPRLTAARLAGNISASIFQQTFSSAEEFSLSNQATFKAAHIEASSISSLIIPTDSFFQLENQFPLKRWCSLSVNIHLLQGEHLHFCLGKIRVSEKNLTPI